MRTIMWCFLLGLLAISVESQQLTPEIAETDAPGEHLFVLSWQAPPPIAGVSADSIVAYHVHWGTQSRTYTEHRKLGKVFSHAILGLNPDKRYFFSVTAHQAQEQLVYSYAETSLIVKGVPKSSVKLATKEGIKPGAKVLVQWHHTGASMPRDWIGLAIVGAPKVEFLAWTYVNCAEHATFAVPKGQCVVTVPVTVKPGDYEVRLFANDGYELVATSAPIQVMP